MQSTSLLTATYCTPRHLPDRRAKAYHRTAQFLSLLWASTSSFRPQFFIYVCVRLPPVFISLLRFWLNFASVSYIPSESEWLIRYSKPTSVLVFPSFPRCASTCFTHSIYVIMGRSCDTCILSETLSSYLGAFVKIYAMENFHCSL